MMVEVASSFPSRRSYRLGLAGLVLAAWLILLVGATSPFAVLLDHHEIGEADFSAGVRWAAFLGGWTVMVVAMMLPGSLPAVEAFLRSAMTNRPAPGRLLRWYLPGYLAVWVAYGAAIYLGDTLLHAAFEAGSLPHAAEPLIPVALLAIAGVYQFTPLKQRCRAEDRLPPSLVRPTRVAMLNRGMSAGLACVGTCGAVMLVMFGLGSGLNFAWMVALTAVTVVERTTEAGKRMMWPLGFALLLWAALRLIV